MSISISSMNISLIISCHKDSPYLHEAIKSALDQRFDSYEIILSSDGWTGAKELAQQYGIETVFIWPRKNHSHALNNSVKFAKGEYIKDLHYDDVLLSYCLADLWNEARERRSPSVIHANAIDWWPDHEYIYTGPESVTWSTLWPPVKNPVHCATMMFKRDDFLRIGGRDESEDIDTAEDYDYYLNVLRHRLDIRHCNKIVAKYRRHSEQKIGTKPGQTERYLLAKYK